MVSRTVRATCRSREFWWTATALVATTVFPVVACSHSNGQSSPSKPGQAGQPGATNAVNVTMVNNGGKDGCALDITSVPAGPVTFTVVNTSAPSITEM